MSDYDRIDPIRAPRPWLRWLILLGLPFVAGLLTMGWALTHWSAATPYLSWMHPPAPVAPQSLAPVAAPIMIPAVDPALMERRVADLEGRITRIAARADAATGNADRAEGLLVAFAARRAIDRGVQLGYIEGMLRERFGRDESQAVATVISSSRQPVTLDELQADLEAITPDLSGVGPQASWWDGFRRELAGLIVVRRADTPPVTPSDRLLRARRNLEAGHVDWALAEVARLPRRDIAEAWIERARRYIAAHNGLDRIETAALLAPTREPIGKVAVD